MRPVRAAEGGFSHTDTAGADKLHWKGTPRGRRLAIGSYKLLVRPYRGKLKGKLVSRGFKVEK